MSFAGATSGIWNVEMLEIWSIAPRCDFYKSMSFDSATVSHRLPSLAVRHSGQGETKWHHVGSVVQRCSEIFTTLGSGYPQFIPRNHFITTLYFAGSLRERKITVEIATAGPRCCGLAGFHVANSGSTLARYRISRQLRGRCVAILLN